MPLSEEPPPPPAPQFWAKALLAMSQVQANVSMEMIFFMVFHLLLVLLI
jgi:hypothetical protein